MPGPNNMMSMTQAGRLGIRRSFPFNLGIWTGFTVVMVLCTALESTLHAILPVIRVPMLFVSAGYMLYLAWKTVKEPVSMEKKDAGGGFLSGCLLQFINPKIYFYCIVSMENYILPFYEGNVPALLGFSLLLSTIGFLFTVVWALFGSLFGKVFSQYGKAVSWVLALLLVYCAVSLFL